MTELGEEIKLSRQRAKAWKIVQAHRRYHLTARTVAERRHDLMLADDDEWNKLADLADVKWTTEPGACHVSKRVKELVFELVGAGEALKYADREEDVFK